MEGMILTRAYKDQKKDCYTSTEGMIPTFHGFDYIVDHGDDHGHGYRDDHGHGHGDDEKMSEHSKTRSGDLLSILKPRSELSWLASLPGHLVHKLNHLQQQLV